MDTSKFCSILSKKSGEPIAGSAPYAKHFIFISWPKKFWGYEALQASGGFPNGLKNWMHTNSHVHGKISIRLVSNKDTNNDKSDIFIYPGQYIYKDVCPKKIIKTLDTHFQKNFKSSKYYKRFNYDQIFICTHGRHDKCCAKYGQKVAEVMRKHLEKENLNIEVWESSHLGGHRFAPTLIDFPNGYSYGRLSSDNIPIFFENRKKNKIFAPAYRGKVFLSEFEQIAEAHLQQYCYSKGLRCNLEIKKIKKISEKKFMCIAKFYPDEFYENYQKYFAEESEFDFILKEFKNPSGCDSINEDKIRECWELQN